MIVFGAGRVTFALSHWVQAGLFEGEGACQSPSLVLTWRTREPWRKVHGRAKRSRSAEAARVQIRGAVVGSRAELLVADPLALRNLDKAAWKAEGIWEL